MPIKTRLAVAVGAAALLLPASGSAQDPGEIARGARLYSDTCGRCHNLRPATERTDANWTTIVAHMRARAVIGKSDARAILAFLQATNLPQGPAATPTAAAATAEPTVAPPPSPMVASPTTSSESAPDAAAEAPETGLSPEERLVAFELRQLGLALTEADLGKLSGEEREALLDYLKKLARPPARDR